MKQANFQFKLITMSSCKNASYLKEVQEALQDNLFVENTKKCLHINDVNDDFEFNDGLLYFKGILYIPPRPTRLKIIQMHHNLLAARNFGYNNTMELIPRDFWQPQMWKFVKEFLQSCDTCARRKVQ